VKIWDAETGQELLTLRGHSDDVKSVSFSQDGKQIVSGSRDDTVIVWNAETGQEMLTLRGHSDDVMSVSFSPNGQRIVSGSRDGTVKVWDAILKHPGF
jgi:WD40 repeat protein